MTPAEQLRRLAERVLQRTPVERLRKATQALVRLALRSKTPESRPRQLRSRPRRQPDVMPVRRRLPKVKPDEEAL
jgi:hypothetical protein